MPVSRRTFLARAGALAAQTAQPARPNVLTILSDQLNAVATSVYGGPVPTPNLERLARRGVVFRNATCPTPFCSPSRASLITGLYPHRHGIVYNCMRVDYPAVAGQGADEGITRADVTTDKILNSRGYDTHQYGKWHLSGDALPYYPDQYGECREYAREMVPIFDEVRRRPREQWMDWYGWILPVTVDQAYRQTWGPDDPIHDGRLGDFIRKMGRLEIERTDTFDVRVADRTVERLRKLDDRPFSITCSLMWPHDPNVVPAPYYERTDPAKIKFPANHRTREPRFEKDVSRQMMARQTDTRLREYLRIYYGTVHVIDEQVGRVLDALERTGRADNTIVIFTADHGDMAGGHGMGWKSTTAFYDEIVRIPMIVSWPGHIQPGRTDAAASLVDLAPTILDLAGESVPEAMQGASLAPVLLGKSSASRFMYGFSERVRANPRRTRSGAARAPAERMIRGDGWKYAVYADGEEFLYDRTKDPGETRNLAAERSARARKQNLAQKLISWLSRTS
jgi:arylsulfatase A-like enzyme